MIDHVLGRPSVELRKFQVFAVFAFWIGYLHRGNAHGFPLIRRLSERLTGKYTAFQIVIFAQLYLYFARNFSKIFNLESPEPLANLYSRSFFRATWVTTALDAGFWTAMSIRRMWLRRTAEMLFTVYYLFAAEQADEKVRKIRSVITVDHMRVSWEKSTTPVLGLLSALLRPRLTRFRLRPRVVKIQRPPGSQYTDPLNCWLYYDGPLAELPRHHRILLNIPGGGFVSMSPRNHDEKLIAYAGRLGIPVISLDYGKAPEHPYPWALHEAYDLYKSLVLTRGRCIGLAGEIQPKIVVEGDSAGGNLAMAMTLLILQQLEISKEALPKPDGLVLIYPALDLNIGSWMTDDQMALVQNPKTRKTNKGFLRKKSMDYKRAAGDKTPYHSDDDLRPMKPVKSTGKKLAQVTERLDEKPEAFKTKLAMSSIMSFLDDRIMNAQMMRAMIILYIGPDNRPDFYSDYLLCPINAPESLLAQLPKTCFMTGELDPLVDNSVLMIGRIRQAKLAYWEQQRELGIGKRIPDEKDWLETSLIPGVSHGFMQIVGLYPDAWRYIARSAKWIEDLFEDADQRDMRRRASAPAKQKRKFRMRLDSSGDEDLPLMMSRIKVASPDAVDTNLTTDLDLRREHSSSAIDSDSLPSRRGSGSLGKRTKSLVSLASEEDLLRRRMEGFAQSLLTQDTE